MGQSLEELGEFGVVELFRRDSAGQGGRVIKGIGDDCAVLAGPTGERLLVTTDMLVEGVHFLRDRLTPGQLGRKCMAVNISDIAAMGGEPTGAFLALGLPAGEEVDFIHRFREGIFAGAGEFGVEILGGDTVAAPTGLVACLTLLGRVPQGQEVLRSTARAGDGIWLGGCVGTSAAGLELLLSGGDSGESGKMLIRAHLEPRPQVALGRLLASRGLATAMIDVSDGVAQDLGHICTGSGLGALLEPDRLPLEAAVLELAAGLDRDPLEWGLYGGEDYCLLFTVAADREEELLRLCAAAGEQPRRIGRMDAGTGVRLQRPDGEERVGRRGYDHFGR